ncbi:endonuclease III [Candidatus Uhrbacteria bacterium]|nr:endonuclease III [Candidatus Uhrbacteria bacterium]
MTPTPEIAAKVVMILGKRYPQKGDMDLGTAEDTLLGVLMSARTTDVQVLRVFPAFRKRFPTWESLARASVAEIAARINTIGLYRSKAKAIKGLAQNILKEFRGKVPRTMDELTSLPGVGRKTASCVLSYAFGIPAIAVDTHVFRIIRRLGWSRANNPEKMEKDLRTLIPQKNWNDVNRSMVRFGRDICVARTPQCWRCPVAKWCAYERKTPKP